MATAGNDVYSSAVIQKKVILVILVKWFYHILANPKNAAHCNEKQKKMPKIM